MDNKKVIAIGLAALVVGGITGAGAFYNPYSQDDLNSAVAQARQVAFDEGLASAKPVVQIKEVTKEVPVEVIKEVVKEVVVTDTELIKAACDRLLFEDLGECQQEVKAEDAALKLAWEKLEEELADEDFLDELKEEGIIADEDEVSVKKLYKDFEDIEIVKSDYDDNEYVFKLKAKLDDEEDDKKVYVIFEVEVSDGEAEVTDFFEE